MVPEMVPGSDHGALQWDPPRALQMVGTDTSPDRPNREILDFETSKKVKNTAKKLFLQKILFFSWEASGSRYFVCSIVLGCGGAGNARTSSLL